MVANHYQIDHKNIILFQNIFIFIFFEHIFFTKNIK